MVPKDTSFSHYIWPTYKVLISKIYDFMMMMMKIDDDDDGESWWLWRVSSD